MEDTSNSESLICFYCHPPDLKKNEYEVDQDFEQQTAVMLVIKIDTWKRNIEDRTKGLRWDDKSLINVLQRFALYNKDSPDIVLRNFKASHDEIAQFKTVLFKENVSKIMIKIQPISVSYNPDNSDFSPVSLEQKI